MPNARFAVPEPRNEPNLHYAPGSPEKQALKAKLAEPSSQEIEIPLVIGGREVRTGRVAEARLPHRHGHRLARWHQAGPQEVAAGIGTARAGRRERAQKIGAYFTSRLLEMKDKYELIGDVRGPGLMLGIELVYSKKTKEPARKEAYEFEKEGIKRGVLIGNSKYAGMGNVVKIKPPLVMSDAQAEKVMQVFEDVEQALSPQ